MTTARKWIVLALTAWPLAWLAVRRPLDGSEPWLRAAALELLAAGLLVAFALFYAVRAWRAPRLARISRALWAARTLAPALQLAVALPLAAATLLVAVEGALGWGIFDPSAGADPFLVQHVRWYEAHRLSAAATVALAASQLASWYALVWRGSAEGVAAPGVPAAERR